MVMLILSVRHCARQYVYSKAAPTRSELTVEEKIDENNILKGIEL